METPKYIINALSRSSYYFGFNSCPGYTIKVCKHSPYAQVRSLKAEVTRIVAWVNRQVGGHAELVSCPTETRYAYQCAVITIFDPVMRHLEKYIKSE